MSADARSPSGTVAGVPVPKRWLNDEETVAVDLHPHWSYLVAPVALAVVAIVAAVIALRATDPDEWTRDVFGWGAVALLVVAVGWLLVRYLRWSSSSFVITNDRLIYRTGVLSRRGIEIPLERVNSVHYEQSLGGRIIGSGTLIVESGGEFGRQHFVGVRDPSRIQRALHHQLDVNERRNRGGDEPSADIVDQIERLEAMRARGTITDEEFELHKRRLL